MKTILTLALVASFIAGCQEIPSHSPSITGQAQGSLPKSPVGSTFRNRYVDNWGQEVTETYQVQSDHSVKLINRDAATRD